MTKTERRISDFSSGMKRLNDKNLNYIHKLTKDLFIVENNSGYSCSERKNIEVYKNNTCLFSGKDYHG